MKMNRFILIILSSLLFGCATSEKAVFVTSTSLSIAEGELAPAGLSVGYKRVDGYIGPNNADGSAPPVIAVVQTDGKVINPKIRQLYATGNAALVASGEPKSSIGQVKGADKDERDVMMFGTSTAIGFSIGTTNSAPTSFVLGYKRKEMSVIPLVEKEGEDKGYAYPAVFASVDTSIGQTGDTADGQFEKQQMFASGTAAVNLAAKYTNEFDERVGIAVDELQTGNIQNISKCYSGVSINMRPMVWKHANFQGLYHEDKDAKGTILKALLDDYDQSVTTDGDNNLVIVNPNRLVQADAAYVNNVSPTGDNKDKTDSDADQDRANRLEQHAEFVCGLAQFNNT